jgi:hypothetical protein
MDLFTSVKRQNKLSIAHGVFSTNFKISMRQARRDFTISFIQTKLNTFAKLKNLLLKNLFGVSLKTQGKLMKAVNLTQSTYNILNQL